MSEAPDNHELARQIAVLEERMNTRQAENETGFERLSKELAQRDRGMIIAILIMIGLATGVILHFMPG